MATKNTEGENNPMKLHALAPSNFYNATSPECGRCVSLADYLAACGLTDHVDAAIQELIPSEVERWSVDVILSKTVVKGTRAISKFGSIHFGKLVMQITELDCSPAERADTLLHEIAHLVAYFHLRHRGHGIEWQRCAVALGAKPNRCGSDDRHDRAVAAKRARQGKVVARCTKCGEKVVRMRRSSRDWSRFTHRACGGGRMEAVK